MPRGSTSAQPPTVVVEHHPIHALAASSRSPDATAAAAPAAAASPGAAAPAVTEWLATARQSSFRGQERARREGPALLAWLAGRRAAPDALPAMAALPSGAGAKGGAPSGDVSGWRGVLTVCALMTASALVTGIAVGLGV